MALYQFHRVLIIAAIVFDMVFTLYCIRKYNGPDGSATEIYMAVATSIVTVGLMAYLIYFNKRMTFLRENLDEGGSGRA